MLLSITTLSKKLYSMITLTLGIIVTTVMARSVNPGNIKGGSITVLLASCLTCLDKPVLQIKTKIVSCHMADSKPVKQEVNRTVILPPLVFPGESI